MNDERLKQFLLKELKEIREEKRKVFGRLSGAGLTDSEIASSQYFFYLTVRFETLSEVLAATTISN